LKLPQYLILILYSTDSHVDQPVSKMTLNDITLNTNYSEPLPPISEADNTNSKGNSIKVIYEEVADTTQTFEVDQKIFLTKCPAYEPHNT